MYLNPDRHDDPLTPLSRLRPSLVMEMLTQLQAALDPEREGEFRERISAAFGESFIARLKDLYALSNAGCDFNEVALEYDGDDVPGFLEFFEHLPPKQLLFLLLGRIYPVELLPDAVSARTLAEFVRTTENDLGRDYNLDESYLWADDIEAYRRRALELWMEYYEGFFRDGEAGFRECWGESLRENRQLLETRGGTELFRAITGYEELPPRLPAGMPYRRIEYIPASRLTHQFSMYYGYGVVSVLYDCRLTAPRREEKARRNRATIDLLKALSDENRLEMLRKIAFHEYRMNGRLLAQKLRLSPSVVSRNLKQLKDAGLLKEQSPDNRNIFYALDRERLDAVAPEIRALVLDI